MTQSFQLVALAYVAFGVALFAFESTRIKRRGADTITVFMMLFVLQCCVSSFFIFALLPYADPQDLTGVYAFDRILRNTNAVTAMLVLCLTVLFVFFFYTGCWLGRTVLRNRSSERVSRRHHEIDIRTGPLLCILGLGLLLTLYSFWLMGDSLLERYTQLILFRGAAGNVERNALNANALALTQAWSWLTVVAIFCVHGQRRWRWMLPICVAALIVFGLLGVSRRALFIPVLMAYLTSVLYSGRWRFRWVAVSAVPIVLVVAFGKSALSALAYGNGVEAVAGTYQSAVSATLRAASDVGISIVESLGTLQYLDLGPRLGFDHLLSMIKLLPEQSLGFDFNYPERIVRLSTAAFDGPGAQDIPPGLIGQMWLDFRVFGPMVWGLVFGLQMSVVQHVFERTKRTLRSVAVFVVVVFVVALPLNSGSFDFTFSVDIVALGVVLLSCVTWRRCKERPMRLMRRQAAVSPS